MRKNLITTNFAFEISIVLKQKKNKKRKMQSATHGWGKMYKTFRINRI